MYTEKELIKCKSINNSDIYNYLRNTYNKTPSKFYRTVSYRNMSLKKNKSMLENRKRKTEKKEENLMSTFNYTSEVDSKYIVKKAVVVGCNYVSEERSRLYGSVNDAYVFCRALVKYFDFLPENILLLTDSLPSNAYIYEDFDINRKKYINVDEEENIKNNEPLKKKNIFNLFNTNALYTTLKKTNEEELNCNSCKDVEIKNVDISSEKMNFNLWPTRVNILKAVNWLVRDSIPFGSYVFYFAGKSVQVDNMSGWEGEGYDEAFLCSDPFNKISEHNVITAVQLKDLLLSINESAQMTIILDCSGGQTILDPAGTENSLSYIKGCKQKGIWPITNPTNKVHKAIYDITILNNTSMKKYFCRSRYSKLIEVESTSAMIDPLLQSISSLPVAPKAYCLCAATWEQISIEGLFPIIEFARVSQLKKPESYKTGEGHYQNMNKKNIRAEKSNRNGPNGLINKNNNLSKKTNYEKNFNFTLNMMKMFFSNTNNNENKLDEKEKINRLGFNENDSDYIDDNYNSDDNNNNNNYYYNYDGEKGFKNFQENLNNVGQKDVIKNKKFKDNYILVSHGVFTYCLIEAIIEFKEKELKYNILEKKNEQFIPMTLKNLINVIQQKMQNIKYNKLKKINQKPEFTIHPGANATNNNYFVHYSKNIHFQNYKCNFINADLSPFLNVNKAWEEINRTTLRNRKSLSLSSTLINTASSKYFTQKNEQFKNSYSLKY
ncbi:hypothetical protein PFFCH_03351 [Plasmodium falciparum FCH/4]|nr:hypothetical protein PFFCH_03351 [Plasmodium falciparum FCH/4]